MLHAKCGNNGLEFELKLPAGGKKKSMMRKCPTDGEIVDRKSHTEDGKYIQAMCTACLSMFLKVEPSGNKKEQNYGP